MKDPFENNHSSLWIPFADFLAGVLSIFLVVAVLLTFHLTETKKKKEDADIATPGTLNVMVTWKEDIDIDLWLHTPGDTSVGYSRKQGRYMDLLRDDLGHVYERVGDHHVENAYARATPPGEYIINVHWFSNSGAKPPIKVDISTTILHKGTDDKVDRQRVLNSTIYLQNEGQELTVMRFQLDSNSELMPETVRNDQVPLRAPPKSVPGSEQHQ